MVLWLILFALVIAVSLCLALQSMYDYQESPGHFKTEYGLFLIRNTAALNASVFDSIHAQTVKDGFIISLERLFKGSKSALVIFGPKDILGAFSARLNLLELEDYTGIHAADGTVWEMGVKDARVAGGRIRKVDNFFAGFPQFEETEQFWWQITLQALAVKRVSEKNFQSQIRAVVISPDLGRRKKLAGALQNFLDGYLIKVPKPFTSSRIMEFYRNRTLSKDITNPSLTTDQVLKLSLMKG